MNTAHEREKMFKSATTAIHLCMVIDTMKQQDEERREDIRSEADLIHNAIASIINSNDKACTSTSGFRLWAHRMIDLLRRMSSLTIREFINIFPIPAYFDGDLFDDSDLKGSFSDHAHELLAEFDFDLYDKSLETVIGDEIINFVFEVNNENHRLKIFRQKVVITALDLLTHDSKFQKKYNHVEDYICDAVLRNRQSESDKVCKSS